MAENVQITVVEEVYKGEGQDTDPKRPTSVFCMTLKDTAVDDFSYEWRFMSAKELLGMPNLHRQMLEHILNNEDNIDFGYSGEAWRLVTDASTEGHLVMNGQSVDQQIVQELAATKEGLFYSTSHLRNSPSF